jgi:hypothetical protein
VFFDIRQPIIDRVLNIVLYWLCYTVGTLLWSKILKKWLNCHN